jgi:DDE superfamily endonuclease
VFDLHPGANERIGNSLGVFERHLVAERYGIDRSVALLQSLLQGEPEPAERRFQDLPQPEAPTTARKRLRRSRQGQTIVFVDESGLSERPHRHRTWAPRGQTPVLQYHFSLSMMAGITCWNFYFKLFPGSIKAPQIIEFLQHLQRHLRRHLLVIWDGLHGHRSIAVRDFVASRGERLTLAFLPGYAPELNPSTTSGAISSRTRSRISAPEICGSSATRPNGSIRHNTVSSAPPRR